ncbi:MAG TPA: hypothetical protein DEB35_12155 [Desulfuromonas sp.]|nr:hypothetical protein [Desulfuromonas sp.]
MRRTILHILLLSLLLAPLSAAAVGVVDERGVSGRLSWRYGDFQADQGGGEDVDASSFSQNYSLLYRDYGTLNGGRGGSYSYLLGGEFTAIDNSINGVDDSLSTIKPLYEGKLLIAPGGLPFRLRLYCGDTHTTTLTEDEIPSLRNTLLTPGIATDFSNGTHREIGATLAVGIKNGSYLGNYRETLSQWPRLLMDYRSLEVESYHSKTPQDYRQRDLAFVSLNKKDNWFHYRYRDFQDFLQPDKKNDYVSQSYILGTIDPNLQRTWVSMTNWIKISADGSYNQLREPRISSRPTETYDANFFAIGAREGFRSTVFSQFQRQRDDKTLRRELSIPLSVRKKVDRDTSWQFNASVDRVLDEGLIVYEQDDVVYLGLRLDTWQSRPYTLSPEVQVEVFDGLYRSGSALEVGLEVMSNRGYREKVDSSVALYLRRFSGEGQGGSSVDYLEEELVARYARRYSSWRLGAEENLLFGNGTMTNNFGHRIFARTTGAQTYTRSNGSDRDGSTVHSITKFYGENGIGRPLTNRLQLLFDYLSTDAGANLQSGLTHDLTYTASRSLRYRMTNAVILGEDQTANDGAIAGGELSSASRTDFTRTFSHTSALEYTPNRSFLAAASLELKSLNGDTGRSLHYRGKQNCRYTYFRINGVVRPLVVLSEDLSYEESSFRNYESNRTELILRADYFPTRHFTLGAYGDFTNSASGTWDEDTAVGSLSAGWTYPMLALRMIYSQGLRTNDFGEREERGIRVQLDKTF